MDVAETRLKAIGDCQAKCTSERGLTLIELLVVVVSSAS
ncbi:MAG TPA: hypothetical protein DCP92_00315 [Nitrospiraceae bacterium]|nr:hypothetical protein [Nitrospiraceae bacterium]